jgi:hypothetical protein
MAIDFSSMCDLHCAYFLFFSGMGFFMCFIVFNGSSIFPVILLCVSSY